ncbi:MAG: YHYH protein [Bacteroidetes bacterium]|nr:MAG: YHYH protein [Bacteroidota bacterium]
MKYFPLLLWFLAGTLIAFSACKKDDCLSVWYQDADGDGLGNPNVSETACAQPSGYVANADDPDDTLDSSDCPPQTIQIGPSSLTLVPVDLSERGACNQSLAFTPNVSLSESGSSRVITSNSIPAHLVGLFGQGPGSLNPNAIAEVQKTYTVPLSPSLAGTPTELLNPQQGPAYAFGVLLNGVLLDPVAAEPWPHEGFFATNVNWEWNLDAMIINLGLDCNNAHVQPNGKYHYHGTPALYLEGLNLAGDEMVLVGYAADGFPIYYKYGYTDPDDAGSGVEALTSSYELKTGERPGDGTSAPCGEYNGVYTNDWQYTPGLGDLDACNGRTGVTPEYPGGIYYYVITDTYPFLSRCLKGSPSNDFRI